MMCPDRGYRVPVPMDRCAPVRRMLSYLAWLTLSALSSPSAECFKDRYACKISVDSEGVSLSAFSPPGGISLHTRTLTPFYTLPPLRATMPAI